MAALDSGLREVDDNLPKTPALDEESPFATLMSLFDEAAAKLGISPDNYAILRKPDRETNVAVPYRLDDGTLAMADGYRVQHNQGLGPFMGPLRIAPDVSVDLLRALAAWMTWKCSILNIPFGGSAGAILLDPRELSRGELERAVRRYVSSLLDIVGPEKDIFGPDIGAGEDVMAWVMDTVSSHERHTVNAAVTGKPVSLAGTRENERAVAHGLRVIQQHAAEKYGLTDPSTRVIIQGAGDVGGTLARLLHADGLRVCGLSDVHGGVYNEAGLDIPELLNWSKEKGTLNGCPGSHETMSNEDLLVSPCEILIPCAVANAVHSRNARAIETKLIIEGAHGPVSARADHILDDRGIPVIPDVLANAGGVVAHYFEWVQNRQGLSWIEAVVRKRLTRFMTEAWIAVQKVEDQYGVRTRMAAHMLAVTRVSAADNLRGIYA